MKKAERERVWLSATGKKVTNSHAVQLQFFADPGGAGRPRRRAPRKTLDPPPRTRPRIALAPRLSQAGRLFRSFRPYTLSTRDPVYPQPTGSIQRSLRARRPVDPPRRRARVSWPRRLRGEPARPQSRSQDVVVGSRRRRGGRGRDSGHRHHRSRALLSRPGRLWLRHHHLGRLISHRCCRRRLVSHRCCRRRLVSHRCCRRRRGRRRGR